MTDKGTIILSAGGTGGHLFPAEALAHTLTQRGWRIHLVTDARAHRFADKFPCEAMHVVESASPSGRNPLRLLKALLALSRGTKQARGIIDKLSPAAVVGFGGYPTIPPMWAAAGRVPTMIHEQNAVMGRANKVLAARVDRIAGGFLKPEGQHAGKIVQTGNPVRPDVLREAQRDYLPSSGGQPFHLVVFGGSQGARYFSRTVPEAISQLSETLRDRLVVTQQARTEDEDDVRARYEALGVTAHVSPFFDNLPSHIGSAHLVIARSGASTVSELATIGRPAILVPYPHALDHDQAANAEALASAGGALVRREADLDAGALANLLADLLNAPERLLAMAADAKGAGMADAATLLADLTEAIASGNGQSQG